MRNSLVIGGALLGMIASGALAQTPSAPAQSGPQNPAISGSSGNQAVNPVKGRNSFTEGEAKSRIEAKGFSGVGQLTKDNDGVWRGRATKEGRQVEVSLDYQGNVVAR